MGLVLTLGLAACDGFGWGQQPQDKAEDAGIDLSGTDVPADLPGADEAAMAAIGATRIVDATAEVSEAVADALGDLFPSEDNPCPDGGSASSDLSGSLNHPRIRMEFHQCVRGDLVLDGIATIRCDDLSGTDCKQGTATLGEDSSQLRLTSNATDLPHLILMQGNATVRNDKDAQHLSVLADLQGEVRSLAEGGPRYSFVAQALQVDLQKTADDQTEMRIDGVAGLGGGAAAAHCISGRFDTETPTTPLILQGRTLSGGLLRLYSPPPRPGTQQADATFSADGASVLGADGMTKVYTAQELAGFCALQ